MDKLHTVKIENDFDLSGETFFCLAGNAGEAFLFTSKGQAKKFLQMRKLNDQRVLEYRLEQLHFDVIFNPCTSCDYTGEEILFSSNPVQLVQEIKYQLGREEQLRLDMLIAFQNQDMEPLSELAKKYLDHFDPDRDEPHFYLAFIAVMNKDKSTFDQHYEWLQENSREFAEQLENLKRGGFHS